MRFEPKIVRPQEKEPGVCDAELPDDLARLAGQLGEEAASLAATYPPQMSGRRPASGADERGGREPSAKTISPRRSRRRWPLAAAVAAILLAAGWWALWQVSSAGPEQEPAVAGGQRRDVHPGKAGPAEWPAAASAAPAAFLQEVSGPELEGVLDLLEHGNAERASLSI